MDQYWSTSTDSCPRDLVVANADGSDVRPISRSTGSIGSFARHSGAIGRSGGVPPPGSREGILAEVGAKCCLVEAVDVRRLLFDRRVVAVEGAVEEQPREPTGVDTAEPRILGHSCVETVCSRVTRLSCPDMRTLVARLLAIYAVTVVAMVMAARRP